MTNITILDESTLGQARAWTLTLDDLLNETISLRELIRQRIYQEVREYNATLSEHFEGLVQPSEAQRTLNGYRLRQPRRISWEAQYERALDAFTRRGYIVLVDDEQVADLDASVTLHAGSEVTFLRLVPLVGG